MGEVNVRVTMSPDFEASDRLRRAIESVVEAYERTHGATADSEVEGYTWSGPIDITKPTGSKYGPREPLSFRDGCWLFSTHGDEDYCGWYQYQGDSCLSHSW